MVVRAETVPRHNADTCRIKQIIGYIHRVFDLFARRGFLPVVIREIGEDIERTLRSDVTDTVDLIKTLTNHASAFLKRFSHLFDGILRFVKCDNGGFFCAIDVGLEVLCDWMRDIADITSSGPAVYPIRHPVIA